MHNGEFEQGRLDEPQSGAWYDAEQREEWIMLAGALSVLFAAIAGVLVLLARRRPTRLQRAEAALAAAAGRAEYAARTVRKQGPSMVAHSASRAEQAARAVRKQGPSILRQGVEQTGKAVERTRAVGDSVVGGTQDLFGRVQKRINR